jgi:hypothetical protein
MDFFVAKLTGNKWIRNFNKSASTYDQKIASPRLNKASYLYTNDYSVGAKGKIEFEHFIKILVMISK